MFSFPSAAHHWAISALTDIGIGGSPSNALAITLTKGARGKDSETFDYMRFGNEFQILRFGKVVFHLCVLLKPMSR